MEVLEKIFPLVFVKLENIYLQVWKVCATQAGETANTVTSTQSGPCACGVLLELCLCLLPVFVRACLRARLSVSLMFAVAPSVD